MGADKDNGIVYYRPVHWARVNTSLGTMLEPFLWPQIGFAMGTLTQVDHEDEIMMVNQVEIINLDKVTSILGDNTHGYYTLESRVGR